MEDMDEQWVLAQGSFAYGVIGADLHVHGAQGMSYRLVPVDGLVPGDQQMHRWPDGRLTALWLHGPDFARTGVAAESIAAELAEQGWTVLEARLAAAEPPANQMPAPASGVVIIVKGADDWSTPELTWLLSNALVHHATTPTRLLLTASTMSGLPALRAALARLQADIHPLEITPPTSN